MRRKRKCGGGLGAKGELLGMFLEGRREGEGYGGKGGKFR